MSYGVLVQNMVQAMNIDALNRTAKFAADVENGSIFTLGSLSTTAGEGEVWEAATPVTATLNNCWMACSPEVVVTNAQYKGLDPDPRNFINKTGYTFDVFKPLVGDIITVTADALTGTKSTNEYVNAANNAAKLTWGSSQTESALSFKLIETTYITIGSSRVTAYKLVCLAN